MSDLLWHEVAGLLRFSTERRAAGWPNALTLTELASLQYPAIGDATAKKEARRRQHGMVSALKSAVNNGALVTVLVEREVSSWLRAFGERSNRQSFIYPEGCSRGDRGRTQCKTTEHPEKNESPAISCAAFDAWWMKQHEESSRYISAWLKTRAHDETSQKHLPISSARFAFDLKACLPSFPSSRANDWAKVAATMVEQFYGDNERCPDEAEAWSMLWDNPPKSYGITPTPADPRDKESEAAIEMGREKLTKTEFRKRWGRWVKSQTQSQ